MKKLEKQIKIEAENILPNDTVRNKVLSDTERQDMLATKVHREKKCSFWTSKRIAIMATACSLVICMTGGALGLYYFAGDGSLKQSEGFLSAPTSKNAFVLSIGSAFQMADDMKDNSLQTVAEKSEDDLLVDEIEKNLDLLNGFISENSDVYVPEPSDRDDYEYKAKLTIDNDVLIIYYNVVGEEVATVTDKDKENEDEFDFEQEQYSIRGIAIDKDNIEYHIFGEKEIEENESEIKMYIVLDQLDLTAKDLEQIVEIEDNSDIKNYIKVEQEIEEDGQDFNYTIIKNNQKVDKFSIETEMNDNNQFYHYKQGFGKDMTHIKYHMLENKNKTMIKIDYKKGDVVYKVDLTTRLDKETNEIVKEYKIRGEGQNGQGNKRGNGKNKKNIVRREHNPKIND